MAVVLFLGVGLGLLLSRHEHRGGGPVASSSTLSAAPEAGLAELNKAFAAVAQKVTPAVVNINTHSVVRQPLFEDPFFGSFGPMVQQKRRSLGSGVLVRANGYVVTNHHVIEGAEQIVVTLADGRSFQARVVGTDPATDIGVVKIEATGLPYLTWGDSKKLQVGEWVIAVGSPFGLSQTVTAGIVSALGRRGIGVSEYENFIQTDAAINQGNSGGALVDIAGNLVGINTLILSKTGGYEGIGLAVPSELAQSVSDSLISAGFVVRGWTGLILDTPDPFAARRYGLPADAPVVVGLYRDSPAHQAGFAIEDVILAFDGKPLQGIPHLRQLIRESRIGSRHTLEVWRAGDRVSLEVTIQQQPTRAGEPVGGI